MAKSMTADPSVQTAAQKGWMSYQCVGDTGHEEDAGLYLEFNSYGWMETS